jgi:uncharacterized lipoprotein YbaY
MWFLRQAFSCGSDIHLMKAVIFSSLLVVVLSAGCGGNTTTPTTTTTTVPAVATTTETFSGTLSVGGSVTYPFTVSQSGTVSETLVSISGAGVPATVLVKMAIGTPGDSGCTATTSSIIKAGTTAQVTATEQPGVFCASLADVGNLFAPAAFTVTVNHP